MTSSWEFGYTHDNSRNYPMLAKNRRTWGTFEPLNLSPCVSEFLDRFETSGLHTHFLKL
jgi:hypothetical protein